MFKYFILLYFSLLFWDKYLYIRLSKTVLKVPESLFIFFLVLFSLFFKCFVFYWFIFQIISSFFFTSILLHSSSEFSLWDFICSVLKFPLFFSYFLHKFCFYLFNGSVFSFTLLVIVKRAALKYSSGIWVISGFACIMSSFENGLHFPGS